VKRVPVSSSSVAALGYDRSSSVLEVEFTSGRAYRYFDVPEIVYHGLVRARSIGQFLNERIRDRYRFEELPR
jgi:hypothetical protein